MDRAIRRAVTLKEIKLQQIQQLLHSFNQTERNPRILFEMSAAVTPVLTSLYRLHSQVSRSILRATVNDKCDNSDVDTKNHRTELLHPQTNANILL